MRNGTDLEVLVYVDGFSMQCDGTGRVLLLPV